MRVRIGWSGQQFEVATLDVSADPTRPNDAALDFIQGLNSPGTSNRPDPRFKAMVHRIQQHADNGPLTNKEHSRNVGDDLYEFKTRFGDRVLFFYDRRHRRRTVLVGGCLKSDFENAKQTSKRHEADWESWQGNHPWD